MSRVVRSTTEQLCRPSRIALSPVPGIGGLRLDPSSEGGSLTRAFYANSGFILVRVHLTQHMPLLRQRPPGIGSALIVRLSTFA
jgi:hypothetical protein